MPAAAEFDPESILRELDRHGVRYVLIGGLAATLHGADHRTNDVDITPERGDDNLARLAAVLVVVDARVRTEGVVGGLPFDRSATMLKGVSTLNLDTRYGDMDITFEPAGTTGYEDLRGSALEVTVSGSRITLAALADVIRSKTAANRPKDREALPRLRALLDRLNRE